MKQQIVFALCIEYETTDPDAETGKEQINLEALQHQLEYKVTDAIEAQRQESMLSIDGLSANFITLDVMRIDDPEESQPERQVTAL
ncbi:hypothetical protein R50073_50170 (plasmid) [Maricurvus nonylphenolicus]|uniref:hypothetical protein n=1 Tax=Maricurvus nonylphenolicus TaxID=1008307 RepID=UPI0036F4148D